MKCVVRPLQSVFERDDHSFGNLARWLEKVNSCSMELLFVMVSITNVENAVFDLGVMELLFWPYRSKSSHRHDHEVIKFFELNFTRAHKLKWKVQFGEIKIGASVKVIFQGLERRECSQRKRRMEYYYQGDGIGRDIFGEIMMIENPPVQNRLWTGGERKSNSFCGGGMRATQQEQQWAQELELCIGSGPLRRLGTVFQGCVSVPEVEARSVGCWQAAGACGTYSEMLSRINVAMRGFLAGPGAGAGAEAWFSCLKACSDNYPLVYRHQM
ncbi:hypothetical protein Tco_0715041 [Tanacetum coccineum]